MKMPSKDDAQQDQLATGLRHEGFALPPSGSRAASAISRLPTVAAGPASRKDNRHMDVHLYAVGEIVGFRSSSRGRSAPAGSYRVVSRLPEQDGEPSYRIKSDLERHERIARESELRERQ
jgi:hypothetical protein